MYHHGYYHRPNAVTTSINSFKEIGTAFLEGLESRKETALNSPYDFANYLTLGLLGGVWSEANERASKSLDSLYDFTNYLSFGAVGTIKGAIAPEELFSPEHWMNSFGVASMLIGGIQLFSKPTPQILLNNIDDSIRKQVLNKADDTCLDKLAEGTTDTSTYKVPDGGGGITSQVKVRNTNVTFGHGGRT